MNVDFVAFVAFVVYVKRRFATFAVQVWRWLRRPFQAMRFVESDRGALGRSAFVSVQRRVADGA